MISPISFSPETRTTSYIVASPMFSATIKGPATFVMIPCRIPSTLFLK